MNSGIQKNVRLYLVDDHRLMNEGLKQVLEAKPGYIVERMFTEAGSLLEDLNFHKPDIIISDISMPGMDGITLAKIVLERFPKIRFVFLTMHLNAQYIRPAMQMGVHGYILKDSRAEDIFEAIDTVCSGKRYLSPKAAALLLSGPDDAVVLTPRETQVLRALALGYSTKDISDYLNISISTVDSHRKNLLLKTDCRNVAELILWGVESGYVDPASRKG
ncbi:MAG: response regulator transcription factor [Bacteroidetes bacterium]|nr:response regulator transcription factor [Bacteroidota bacterium]